MDQRAVPPSDPEAEVASDVATSQEPDRPAASSRALGLQVGAGDGTRPVKARGEVDARSAPELRDRLRELAESGARHVVLDVKDLDFKDWTGLGVLVGARKQLREAGGDLVLRSPSPDASRLLERSGMGEVFTVED